jgi:hypothetical protein
VLAKVPKLDAQQAGLQTVSVGQVAIGPIAIGQLVVNGVDFSMSGAQGVLRNVSVTVTLDISVEWHVHVGLPDKIPDINEGGTIPLGSFSFTAPTIPQINILLNNVHLNIPSLTAQTISASASPLGLQLSNVAADQIEALNVDLPTAGFTITGLTLSSVAVNGIDVPAANVGQATIGHLHGDPLTIPSFTLGALNLPTVTIPAIHSSAPLDIPSPTLILPGGNRPGFGDNNSLLSVHLDIQPSALTHIDQLDITGANANATVGQAVLNNVTLPYDVLNLTLSQIGINTIEIPTFTV